MLPWSHSASLLHRLHERHGMSPSDLPRRLIWVGHVSGTTARRLAWDDGASPCVGVRGACASRAVVVRHSCLPPRRRSILRDRAAVFLSSQSAVTACRWRSLTRADARLAEGESSWMLGNPSLILRPHRPVSLLTCLVLR